MKTSQISIWIVLGLIILFATGLLIYYSTRIAVKPVVEKPLVPADAATIYDFVVGCLDLIAMNGLGRISIQGGYINIPADIIRNPKAYIPLDPFGIAKTPLWYFEGEDRSPDINFIKRELELFIERELPFCIANFTAFAEQPINITEKTPHKAKITFTEKEVAIELFWTLEIFVKEKLITLEKFVHKIDIPLLKMWELSKAIMNFENEKSWFEELTIDLLAAHPEIPMNGLEFACKKRVWRIEQVSEELKKALYFNIPTIRVKGTRTLPYDKPLKRYKKLEKEAKEIEEAMLATDDFLPLKDPPDDAFQYFRMTFDPGYYAPDFRVAFQYLPQFGMLLSAQPNDGGKLESNLVRGGRFIRFFCMNQWHFTYDIIYPVLALVKSDKALKGAGYVFQFGFPVIIKRNAPDRLFFGLRQFRSIEMDVEFCNRFSNKAFEVRALSFEPGAMFASELEDANITLRCAIYDCPYGFTRADEGIYRLRSFLPVGCANPFVIAQKDGYLEGRTQLIGDHAELYLTPLKNLTFKVLKRKYYSKEGHFGEPEELGKRQSAIISISLIEKPFDQFLEYPSNATTTAQFALADMHYNIEIFLRDALGNAVGGFRAENMTIAYSDLIQNDNVTFEVLEWVPTPANDEERAAMLLYLMEKQKEYEILKPKFE